MTSAPIAISGLTYLERLGKLWRVFGAGWHRRVISIRIEACAMTGQLEAQPPDDGAVCTPE